MGDRIMKKYEIVEELVSTRINGNQIKGCATYENMLKKITKQDIQDYNSNFSDSVLYGSKLEMIEQIRNRH